MKPDHAHLRVMADATDCDDVTSDLELKNSSEEAQG